MATPNKRVNRPWRTLTTFGILLVIGFGALFAGTKFSDASLMPNLALDLEGGTQIILAPQSTDGSEVTPEAVDQAIAIIRQRVDASGVAEAEITSQGGKNIVVGLPGKPTQETLDLVRKPAQLRFRSVLWVGDPAPTVTSSASATPSVDTSATPADTASPAATSEASQTPTAASTATAEPSASAQTTAAAEESETAAPAESAEDTEHSFDWNANDIWNSREYTGRDYSDLTQVPESVWEAYTALDCTDPANRVGGGGDDRDDYLVTCQTDGTQKFVLGPTEIDGYDVASAESGLYVGQNNVVTNDWVVNITFNDHGTDLFTNVTKRLSTLPTLTEWYTYQSSVTTGPNMFAIVLDGLTVSAPGVTQVISGGKAEISGGTGNAFTREEATLLANQLKFGSLPLSFTVQSENQISATLGSEQLQKGLLAGVIGLVLVMVYSLFQYRALGLVTVASLIIAAFVTYLTITILSWQIGYRLSLPGVAGLIVAIGITADSFIVYFERIRDELRDGRPLLGAVQNGWDRAKRTILASDAVNLIAAVVLYMVAVGGVRGFAFTLGLTTLIDVLVVFLFTHPVMLLLAKRPFFADGHRWSGLDPRRLGVTMAHYAGRGRIIRPAHEDEKAGKGGAALASASSGAATASATGQAPGEGRETIAQRRARERASERESTPAAADTDAPHDDAASTEGEEN